ncbi:MAG: TIGR00725 family protein [Gemmatimonadota bacterium]
MSAASDRPYRVAVIGGSAAADEDLILARDIGVELARAGAVLVCGGLGGVMEAAAAGARTAGGLTLGILPGVDARAANPHILVPLPTGMGEARNALVVRAAEAVVAVGGEWGTLSEISLARKMGIEVLTLGPPPAEGLGLPSVTNASDAVAWALETAERCREDTE